MRARGVILRFSSDKKGLWERGMGGIGWGKFTLRLFSVAHSKNSREYEISGLAFSAQAYTVG